jgi:archaemetzincin
MKAIHLQPVGATGPGTLAGVPSLDLLHELAAALARAFEVSCPIHPVPLDVRFAFEPVRNQYHSTAILQRMEQHVDEFSGEDIRWLGVTGLDLYVPVLTFVFGEAQLQGRCALVSLHRLREEFYGLPASNDLLHDRLLKEAVHELGHTFGLRHCSNWQCVMASTHAVERLDVKSAEFCPACRAAMSSAPVSLSPTFKRHGSLESGRGSR